VRGRAGLGQTVALLDDQLELGLALCLQLGAERGGARVDESQLGEVVLRDERILGQLEDDRRDQVRPRDAIVCNENTHSR
jgi:hypothetical protein